MPFDWLRKKPETDKSGGIYVNQRTVIATSDSPMPLPIPVRSKTESYGYPPDESNCGPVLPLSPSQEVERDELLRRGPNTLSEPERQRLLWLLSRPSIESKATLQIQKRVPFMPR